MTAQKVDARIIDVNGFGGLDDGLEVRESALSAMSVYEAKALDGELYVASVYNAFGVGAVLDFRLMSQAIRKIKFSVEARDNRIRMQIYQAPTLNANGAVLTAAPPTFGVNLTTNFIWQGPTVGAVGTLRFDGLVGAVMDYLYTIQPLIEYLVRFTNVSGVANIAGINIGTFV